MLLSARFSLSNLSLNIIVIKSIKLNNLPSSEVDYRLKSEAQSTLGYLDNATSLTRNCIKRLLN